MNDFFEDIRRRLSDISASTLRFYRANSMLVLSGFTILSILLIVWGRFGFTLDFYKSFASSGQCHWQSPDERSLPECACNTSTRSNMCHVCTPSWKEGNSDYSDGQWTAWDNEGLCRPSCPLAKFPYLTGRTKKDGSAFSVPRGCVEKPDDCPDGYHALTVGGGVTICDGDAAPTIAPTIAPTVVPTIAPASKPAITITTAPSALVGQAMGTISGSATDAVHVNTIKIVIRSNPKADGTCNTDSKDWNGTAWVTGCSLEGQLNPTFTPGTSTTWSLSTTPPLGSMAAGSYMIFAGAWRDAYGSEPWSGYITKAFTFAEAPITTPTKTPVETPKKTPTTDKLSCAPVSQTVAVGQSARVEAAGGTGSYQWTALEDGDEIDVDDRDDLAIVRFNSVGSQTVRVTSGKESASCRVAVVEGAEETPTSESLVVVLTGRNASTNGVESDSIEVRTGQQVEFRIQVANRYASGNLNSVTLRATLPEGLSYVLGSTTVRGVNAGSDSIAAGGLSLGGIGAGQDMPVTFRATVLAGAFPVGVSQAQVSVRAQSSGVNDASDSMTISVTRVAGGTSGVVQTGPGEALLAAFLVSAIMTLLYVSYTHTSSYKRREIGTITRQRDPLDFRS